MCPTDNRTMPLLQATFPSSPLSQSLLCVWSPPVSFFSRLRSSLSFNLEEAGTGWEVGGEEDVICIPDFAELSAWPPGFPSVPPSHTSEVCAALKSTLSLGSTRPTSFYLCQQVFPSSHFSLSSLSQLFPRWNDMNSMEPDGWYLISPKQL